MRAAHIVARGTHGVLDLFGPTMEFLASPAELGSDYCVMLGTIPPGVAVQLHSHPDDESFYVLSGRVQVLALSGDAFEWIETGPGDFVQIPGGAKHAFRNTFTEPVVQLITTSARLGTFFQEVGRPTSSGAPAPPPTPAEVDRFVRIAARYDHWIGSPEENAAVGIEMPADFPSVPDQ
jgi:quercetin dioxygenase-like cupin family protein